MGVIVWCVIVGRIFVMGVGRRWWFVKGLVRNLVITRIVEEEVNELFCLVLVGVEQRDAEAETHGNRSMELFT